MSELFSDEFLSAYLDGELSPQERAAVERWIERAPEARQRLEDFRGLSRLFGELSRTELPREFPTEVMHLAERRMLLPDAAAANGRMRIRGWKLALAATATAAGLLLTLTIFNVDDRAPGAGRVARNNPPGPAPELAASAKPAVPGDQTNVQIAQDERSPRPAEQPGAGGAMPPTAAPPEVTGGVASGLAGGAGPAAAAAKFKADVSDSRLSATVDSDRQLQDIHAAMQAMRDSGSADKYMLVVKARAVDWADGLVLLQKDFAAHNILVDAPDAGKLQPVADDKPRGEASSEGLYIEADAEAVIAGFKTILARRHPGVQFVVEPSIELAALDQEWHRNLLRSGVEQSAGDFSRGDDAAKGSKDADAKTNKRSSQPAVSRKGLSPTPRAAQLPGGKEMIDRSASVPPPGKDDKVAGENGSPAAPEGNQTTNNARQMIISNLPQAIQNRARSSGDVNSAGGKSNSRGSKEQASAHDEKSRDDKSDRGNAKPLSPSQEKRDERSPVLVRMLIVIESEPQQPVAPADKKGTSGGAS